MEDLTQTNKDTLIEDITEMPNSSIVPTGANLEQKLGKAAVAMPDKTIDELERQLASGNEEGLRNELAAKVDQRKTEAARGLVYEMAQDNQGWDASLFAGVATIDPTDPNTVLETEFVNKALDLNLAMSKNEEVQEVANSYRAFLSDPWSELAIKEQVAKNTTMDYRDKYNTLGWGEWAVSGGIYLWGLPSWGNIVRDNPSGLKATSYLMGEAGQQKAEQLWNLPPNEFAAALKAEVEQLWYNNAFDAMQFLDYVNSPSDSGALFDNLSAIASLPVGGGAVRSLKAAGSFAKGMTKARGPSKAVIEALSAEQKYVKAVQDTTAVLGKEGVTPELAMNAAGNTEDAAVILARKQFVRGMAPNASKLRLQQVEDLVEHLPDAFNPNLRLSRADTYAINNAEKIAGHAARNAQLIQQVMRSMGRIDTMTPEAMNAAFSKGLSDFKSRLPTTSDHIHNARRIEPEDNFGTGQWEITLGTYDGAFKSAEDAQQAATNWFKLPEGSYLIEQQGAGYWVQAYDDVSETGSSLFDELMLTDANKSKNQGPFWWLTQIASAKEAVSPFQASQRGVAVQAATRIESSVKELMKPMYDLKAFGSKQQWKDFNTILTIARDTERVPGDPTTMGKFYSNVGELGTAYMVNLKRIPSQLEVDAYFNYTMVSDLDYAMRSIALAKSKVKRGVTGWEVQAFNAEGVNSKLYLEGSSLPEFPSSQNVSFVEIAKGGSNVTRKFNDLGTLRKELEEKFKAGELRVIRLDDAENALVPILGNDADRVAYVVLHDAKRTPVNVSKQLNYNPGGHVVYQQNYFVKQPLIIDGEHRGDNTLLSASSQAEADDLAKRVGTALDLHSAKNPKALEDYLRRNLPWTPDEFEDLLKQGKIKKAPVVGMRSGEYTGTPGLRNYDGQFLDFSGVDVSSIRAFEDTYQGAKDFTQSRLGPLKTIRKGGAGDPLWKMENADKVAPMSSMANTMGRLVRNAVYEDYQFQAARSWIEEFGNAKNPKAPGLVYNNKPVPIEKLRKNPLFYLKNAEIASANPVRKRQAQQIRSNIINLVSHPSKTAQGIDYIKNSVIADTLYSKGLTGASKYVAEKEIPFLKDPFSYARAVAFHTKLGLFNPIQFFLQSTASLNSIAFSPVNGLKAAPASSFVRMSLLSEDPKIIDHMASMAAKTSGFSKETFKDARYWMQEFGLDIIGREQAYLDDVADPKVFRSKVGKVFLDKGPVFFNEGEKISRIQSWMTSYLDFAQKNPKSAGKLTQREAKIVRDRAELMYGNMTRDANAFWQRGLTGNFTQFYTYNARMVELMVGTQTTVAEKARLFAMFSTLWGIPLFGGVGMLAETGDLDAASSGMLPFGDDLAEEALKKGYKLHEGMTGALYDGLVSTAAGLVTGEDLDFSSRYGLNPFSFGENIETNQKKYGAYEGLAYSALGASGSIGADIAYSVIPVLWDMAQMSGETGSTDLLVNDVLHATREVSAANYAYQLGTAALGMSYLSKNGTVLKGQDNLLDRAVEATIGVQTQEDFDSQKMMDVMIKRKDEVKTLEKRVKELNGYRLNAIEMNDLEQAKTLRKQIEAMLVSSPLTPRERHRLLYPRFEEDSAMAEKTLKSFQKIYPQGAN
jgi:hypothetical protein